MAGFAAAWCAFLLWALATFTALERLWPRHGGRPGVRRIAIAAALLAADAAIARAIMSSPVAPGSVACVALGWLLAECLLYWGHRAMHRIPLLWRFHRLHHDGEPLTWVTAWYVHPVDAAMLAACAVLGGAIAGGAPAAAWFIVGRRAWTVLLHANVAWPASALDAIVATPPFHHRHHREDLAPANFASSLPVLDRVFGTYAAEPNACAAPAMS